MAITAIKVCARRFSRNGYSTYSPVSPFPFSSVLCIRHLEGKVVEDMHPAHWTPLHELRRHSAQAPGRGHLLLHVVLHGHLGRRVDDGLLVCAGCLDSSHLAAMRSLEIPSKGWGCTHHGPLRLLLVKQLRRLLHRQSNKLILSLLASLIASHH